MNLVFIQAAPWMHSNTNFSSVYLSYYDHVVQSVVQVDPQNNFSTVHNASLHKFLDDKKKSILSQQEKSQLL